MAVFFLVPFWYKKFIFPVYDTKLVYTFPMYQKNTAMFNWPTLYLEAGEVLELLLDAGVGGLRGVQHALPRPYRLRLPEPVLTGKLREFYFTK